MGALPQQRKNPFMVQGLTPGLTLRMALSRREDADSLVTRVEDVSEERIEVLVPMQKLRQRPLAPGTIVHAAYVYQRKRFKFVTEVVGHSADGQLEYLRAPGLIESSERRGAFRLETSIKPSSLYRLVIDANRLGEDDEPNIDGTIVDLSEGGMCISTPTSFQAGERLGIQAVVGEGGAEIRARMLVTSVDEPRMGQRNRRVHCKFTDISLADRDKVARYLIKRQIEMRRRGQL